MWMAGAPAEWFTKGKEAGNSKWVEMVMKTRENIKGG